MEFQRACIVATDKESLKRKREFLQGTDKSYLVPSMLANDVDSPHIHVLEELTCHIPYYLEFNFACREEYQSYLIFKALEELFKKENYDLVVFLSGSIDSAISIQSRMTLGYFRNSVFAVNPYYQSAESDFGIKHRLDYLNELAIKNADVLLDQMDQLVKNRNFAEYEELKEAPKVSVIIPFYNAHKYINETLESLEKNDYPNIEIIIVNDGSTKDEALQCLQRLESKYKILHKTNGGVTTARNEGIRQSSGEFVFFLDADDIVTPDYIRKSVNCLVNNPDISYVISYCTSITEDGRDVIYSSPVYPNYPSLFAVFLGVYSGIFRGSVFDTVKYDENIRAYEDWEFHLSLTDYGYKGIVIPEFNFLYRRRPDSLLNTFKGQEEVDTRKYIREKHRELFDRFGINPEISGIKTFNPDDILDSAKIEKFIAENKSKRICFYGAGLLAKKLVEQYDLSSLDIIGFIDMALDKAGQKLDKYSIYSVNHLEELKPDVIAITVAQKQYVLPYLENIKSSRNLGFSIIHNLI